MPSPKKRKREEEKDESPWKRFILPALLAGGAYGSHRLGSSMLTNEDYNNAIATQEASNQLRRERDLAGGVVEDPTRVIHTYVDGMSRLANSKIWGVPSVKGIEWFRRNISKDNPWIDGLSGDHYDAFRRGSAYSLPQLLSEHAPNTPDYPVSQYYKDLAAWTNQTNRRLGQPEMVEVGRLGKSLAEGTDNMSPIQQRRFVNEALSEEMPDTQFGNYMTKLKGDLSNTLLDKHFPAYAGAGAAVAKTRDFLKTNLPMVLGTTAGITGLMAAINFAKKRAKKQRAKERVQKLEILAKPFAIEA